MSQGTVVSKALGRYQVHLDGRAVECVLSSKLRKDLVTSGGVVVAVNDIRQADPVAVGDEVEFHEEGGTAVITSVVPRRNQFSRRAAGPQPLEQVIVANLDQVIVCLAAANPPPQWHFLDRYLADAESAGLPSIVCMTKTDLPHDFGSELETYERIGYRVLETSSASGQGISEGREAMRERVSVLVGKSGVGKTALLNTLEPGLGLRVGAVSESSRKGRHTTTSIEMFPLAFGGCVVDTPGIKQLGLYGVARTSLDELFREFRPFLGTCRFAADCTHSHEPGCAVKDAVASGGITERRHQSYLKMM